MPKQRKRKEKAKEDDDLIHQTLGYIAHNVCFVLSALKQEGFTTQNNTKCCKHLPTRGGLPHHPVSDQER